MRELTFPPGAYDTYPCYTQQVMETDEPHDLAESCYCTPITWYFYFTNGV